MRRPDKALLNFALESLRIESCHKMEVRQAIEAPSHLPYDRSQGKGQGGVLLTSLSAMSADTRVARSRPNGSMSEEASKNS